MSATPVGRGSFSASCEAPDEHTTLTGLCDQVQDSVELRKIKKVNECIPKRHTIDMSSLDVREAFWWEIVGLQPYHYIYLRRFFTPTQQRCFYVKISFIIYLLISLLVFTQIMSHL